MGLALAPRRTLRAWRNSTAGDSLFPLTKDGDFAARYEALLAMTVGDLRRMLGVPENGLVRGPQGLHAYAPKAVSFSGPVA